MTVFERIKILAKKRGLSLVELNDKAGLGTRTIYHWKNKTPSIDNLKAVAKVLHTTTSYLFGEDEPKHETIDIDDDVPLAYRGKHIPEKYLDLVRNLMDSDFVEGKKSKDEWFN